MFSLFWIDLLQVDLLASGASFFWPRRAGTKNITVRASFHKIEDRTEGSCTAPNVPLPWVMCILDNSGSG